MADLAVAVEGGFPGALHHAAVQVLVVFAGPAVRAARAHAAFRAFFMAVHARRVRLERVRRALADTNAVQLEMGAA